MDYVKDEENIRVILERYITKLEIFTKKIESLCIDMKEIDERLERVNNFLERVRVYIGIISFLSASAIVAIFSYIFSK